jgi:hypothetical protein
MNIKAAAAIFAILDVTLETAAKQKAFQEVVISYLAKDEDASKQIYSELKAQSDYNLDLYRAKIRQYAELDLDDLINGDFDF